MKVLFLMTFLVGCGETDYIYLPGEEITTEIEKEIIVEPEQMQAFTGYFNLNGPSTANCIYLDEKIENVVDIESDCQSLVSVNPENGTLGQFPRVSQTNLLIINGEIRFTVDLNYTSGNDIEEDVSGSNITGRRRTDFRIYFSDSGELKVNIKVYGSSNNNNLNEIVVNRTFTEIK